MRAADLRLVELLDFAPEEGRITLGDRRLLLWDADAFGTLRRELIDRLGVEVARGILRRFGFANGYRDALSTRDLLTRTTDEAWWLTCPALQAHEGKVRPEIDRLAIDRVSGEFVLEVRWHDSYEAAQHLRAVALATTPVCWTLAGYASGFSTAVFGEEVFVVEHACVAAGADTCRVVGRTRREWGDDGDRIAADYSAPAPARELLARDAEVRRTLPTPAHAARGTRSPRASTTRSHEMEKVVALAAKVALVDATVLITGESGVGKERIARGIHDGSPRKAGLSLIHSRGRVGYVAITSATDACDRASVRVGMLQLAA